MSKMDFASSYEDALNKAKKADLNAAYGRAVANGDFERDCYEHDWSISDFYGDGEEQDDYKPIIDFEFVPYLCGFFKQFLTLDPDAVDADYTSTSTAISAAVEKAAFYGNKTDGVRVIGDDAAGFIYADRNSGIKYLDIFTPYGELDVPYTVSTIAEVIEHYMPCLATYAMDLKKRGRGYDNAVRFLNELLNVPTELIEGALAYIGGEH